MEVFLANCPIVRRTFFCSRSNFINWASAANSQAKIGISWSWTWISDRRSVGQFVFGAALWSPWPDFKFCWIWHLLASTFKQSSLTTERACLLKWTSLTGQSGEGPINIYQCLIWDSPGLRVSSSYLYSPGEGWPRCTPGQCVSFRCLWGHAGWRWSYSKPSAQALVKVILRPTVIRPVCSDIRPPSVTRNQFSFLFTVITFR
jgi:hypothetical protein